MTAVGVDICDACGKRMPQGKDGNLILTKVIKKKYYQTNDTFKSNKNIRNWTCCKDCVNKMSAMKMIGDYVREDIETLIDEHCGKREKKVLTKKRKKVKDIQEVIAE